MPEKPLHLQAYLCFSFIWRFFKQITVGDNALPRLPNPTTRGNWSCIDLHISAAIQLTTTSCPFVLACSSVTVFCPENVRNMFITVSIKFHYLLKFDSLSPASTVDDNSQCSFLEYSYVWLCYVQKCLKKKPEYIYAYVYLA